MSIINKKSLIFLTSILLVIISILVIKQTKPVELDEVKIIKTSNNNSFAMYVGKDNIYEEYQSDKFPSGHSLNLEKSKCLDNKGNEQKGVLSYENGLVTVTSGNTSYCYLYFDEKVNLSNVCDGTNMQECLSNKKEELKTIENLSTELKGNMYRYQGFATDVDNNYICFGTSDKDKCVQDTDHFMYRIIGIEESGRIKVIKKEALNREISWADNYTEDIKWPQSNVFLAINGADFLEDKNYVPEDWKDKMFEKDWLYGDILISNKNYNGKDFYEVETAQKDADWKPDKNSDIILAKWSDIIPSRVSLMYISDYLMSISDSAICNSYGINDENCKNGWIHLAFNDPNPPRIGYEYVMDRSGYHDSSSFLMYEAINIEPEGTLGSPGLDHAPSIRPTFYLISDIYLSGLGTIDNPYIIN